MLLMAIWPIVSDMAVFILILSGPERDFGDPRHHDRRIHLDGSLGQYSQLANRQWLL